jgi:hypothetical protein
VTDPNETPLPGATITLKDKDGVVVATMTTGSDIMYEFTDVLPGDYKVVEENPPGYPEDVSPNFIDVELLPGDDDKNNDFVDTRTPSGSPTAAPAVSPTSSPVAIPAVTEPSPAPIDSPSESPSVGLTAMISGLVSADDETLLENVLITLLSEDIDKTTMTDVDGYYEFTDLEAGEYTVVETNPVEYPENVSDQDNSPDGDVVENDTTVDNKIGVTLTAGEHDENNDFVDTLTPSGGPPKPPTAAPAVSPTSSPVAVPAVPVPTESPTRTPAVNNTAMISGLVKADDGCYS